MGRAEAVAGESRRGPGALSAGVDVIGELERSIGEPAVHGDLVGRFAGVARVVMVRPHEHESDGALAARGALGFAPAGAQTGRREGDDQQGAK
jgi:hypothetical protein